MTLPYGTLAPFRLNGAYARNIVRKSFFNGNEKKGDYSFNNKIETGYNLNLYF